MVTFILGNFENTLLLIDSLSMADYGHTLSPAPDIGTQKSSWTHKDS